MKLQKYRKSLLIIALSLACATGFAAQDQALWQVGDKVEVQNMSKVWVRATIIAIVDWREYGRGFAYRVRVDDPRAPNTEWAATPDTIRAVNAQPAASPNRPDSTRTPAAPAASFTVGERVDYPGREGRATVLEVGGDGRYKVRLDGCQPYLGERWVDRNDIRPAPTLSAGSAAVVYLFGSWALFEPGAFNTVTRGNQTFHEWGMGGKAPPLQLNADGTYVWKEDSSHTTRGRWRTDAKVTGIAGKASPALEGNADHDGLVIKDHEGIEWKVYKVVIAGKGRDSLVVARICQEANRLMGTRIR